MSGTPDLRRDPRYHSLDVWRGLACLMIVLYHSVLVALSGPALPAASPITAVLNVIGGLSIGVPLFFVISGYCIAATADTSRRRRDSLAVYFLRRFRRIYPPLWIVIVVSVLFYFAIDVVLWPHLLVSGPWSQPRPWWYSGWQWLGNFTLTETWRYHVVGDLRAHFPGQAWTLCYEEQFYLVVGALLLLPRFFFHGAALVSAVTLGTLWAKLHLGWDIEGFFFDGNWLMFAAGLLVYHSVNYGAAGYQAVAGVALATLGLLHPVPVIGAAAASLFAAGLVLFHRYDAAVALSLVTRPLRLCGRMCYSLYLVHQLPVKAVSSALARLGVQSPLGTLVITVPLCVIVSACLGWAFHVLVERRFLNTPRREVRSAPAPALAAAQTA